MGEEADAKENTINLLAQVGICARTARAQNLEFTAYLLSIAELELIDLAYGKHPSLLAAELRWKYVT